MNFMALSLIHCFRTGRSEKSDSKTGKGPGDLPENSALSGPPMMKKRAVSCPVSLRGLSRDMKASSILPTIAVAALSSCASSPEQPHPPAELVMRPGDSITATTAAGTITIRADDELTRTYTWEGGSRSARLWPRNERWYGSLGAYYPGPGEHWREHHGITRGVLQEGQQHFQTRAEALAWLRRMWYLPRSVYRDDGLWVLFAKVPERRQLNVEVFQVDVKGRKPGSLPGSRNGSIRVVRARPAKPA
jgi:hypothetical protein